MRTIDKLQIITTGITDSNGNRIDPDIIEWEEFDKNPILQYDKRDEGHYGVAVGTVTDRQKVRNGWAGRLNFMENLEDADIAYQKYSQGVLKFVSIGGFAAGIINENGEYETVRYKPREVSLVKFPANIECGQVDKKTLTASETEIVNQMTSNGHVIRYLTMSAELNEPVNEPATDPTPEPVEPLNATVDEPTTDPAPEPVEPINASAIEPVNEPLNAAATNQPPAGMNWHERNNSNQQTSLNMIIPEFKQLNCDADFQRRLNAFNAAFRTGAQAADKNPDNIETVKILASSMLQDEKLVILASATNVTDNVTKERKNALNLLVECAAGGAAAATLAAADLGVIKYLSLFYGRMFANDTFRRAVRFVPMSDRTGAIYIESGINAPTYMGNVTPINAPRYFYDDIKRTIARKVFAFTPITFQHADMAVLAYDKQSLGLRDQMGRLMQDISTYWLNVIGNTPDIHRLTTSGDPISTQGLFPIEAPQSNITILKPTLSDLIQWQGMFLMDNYRLEDNLLEVVLPANVYTMLAGDPELRNSLTMENQSNLGVSIGFSATRITPRNPVVRYNTTSNEPELDPAMYTDNLTQDDGTWTRATPATTTPQHIGAGVAFVENQVLAGVGTIELITMPDPMNYGTTISGWVSTGATVARANGVGAGLVTPAVQ